MQELQELREVFNVELPLSVVWSRLLVPETTNVEHCRIAGFPSFDGQAGCRVSIVVSQAQKSLRARKEDMPCEGSTIAIDIGPANAAGWPTRVTVAQSDLPPQMAAMPDAVIAHWRRIVADFRVYLEREVLVPAAVWGASLGALTQQTPLGLVLSSVEPEGYAARCGMCAGDLLLTLRGIRIHDIDQLWTVLALSTGGERTAATWVREGLQGGSATL